MGESPRAWETADDARLEVSASVVRFPAVPPPTGCQVTSRAVWCKRAAVSDIRRSGAGSAGVSAMGNPRATRRACAEMTSPARPAAPASSPPHWRTPGRPSGPGVWPPNTPSAARSPGEAGGSPVDGDLVQERGWRCSFQLCQNRLIATVRSSTATIPRSPPGSASGPPITAVRSVASATAAFSGLPALRCRAEVRTAGSAEGSRASPPGSWGDRTS